MKAWLMDVYRNGDELALWVKTPSQDLRIVRPYRAHIYVDKAGEEFLSQHKLKHQLVLRRTYLDEWKKVYLVDAPLGKFERFISWIEKETRYRVPLYNADIAPEQSFLYEHKLTPCSAISLDKLTSVDNSDIIPLRKAEIVLQEMYVDQNVPVRSISFNGEQFEGEEKDVLNRFVFAFKNTDPDVVQLEYAYSRLPYIEQRLKIHSIESPFHRWDHVPITYRGGKSFWTYGTVRYQDYAVRLRGRFLIDTSSAVGSECEPDGIIELCQLSGQRFQHVASRSFGAVFQSALVRVMVEKRILIPNKEKPLDAPLNLFELLKTDRAGHTFDPLVGFHRNVAEVDFSSMFPWIIHNYNISADTILTKEGPFDKVPGTPIKITRHHKGLIPVAIKPFLDRRMYYKKNPSQINRERAKGLKWVLVTCYGYLRFREFKLGIMTSHMAVCAYAREIIISAAKLAEQEGHCVVHGIIDSLYIKKKNISEDEAQSYCAQLEQAVGIPVSFEGIFKWVVFLPSIVDDARPVPARYYGVFLNGDVKARGIEVRQRSSPLAIKHFQRDVLKQMAECDTKKDIIALVPELCRKLRDAMSGLSALKASWLWSRVRVSKTEYKHNIPQKVIVKKLQKKNVNVMPGQLIRYVYQKKGIVLPEEYNGKPDERQYKKLLVRSLYVLLQPFGITKERIIELSGLERQTKISDFAVHVTIVYVPHPYIPSTRHGYSERATRSKLEREGWLVWRGGAIGILRADEIYPNVRRKYELLHRLLMKHKLDGEYLAYLTTQHGMPDFFCYRNGEFKFVECKLQYESLSRRQERCIARLQRAGYSVEVHKMVDERTKMRNATINLQTREKKMLEQQLTLRARAILPKPRIKR